MMRYRGRFKTSAVLGVSALALVCIALAYTGVLAPQEQASIRERAQRLELPGLPNFFQVSNRLYRGGQPKAPGIAELRKLGIVTVVNLSHSDRDRELFRGSGIRLVEIPMWAFFPSRRGLLRFLEIVADPAQTPLFVHCRHGSDRTGAAVALYRIFIQKWDREEAVSEMVNGGFGFHRIHAHLKRFVRSFD